MEKCAQSAVKMYKNFHEALLVYKIYIYARAWQNESRYVQRKKLKRIHISMMIRCDPFMQ